ncbi:TMV resistance protein N-like isoform X2 [Argentina anserina]|uniref:TMV resistance protein N-like isoform X2 n=1 Tax=Argentina anserina TaxID=57926 RepID=UPI00217661B7|nr:TMV resistance protein N-like isoform X2 [Potentilla anserina]
MQPLPPPPPAQLDEIPEQELKQYDGSDHKEPLLMDINTDSCTPSSSPLNRSSPYDVFLSFRGADTRNNFTGHLYTYLDQKGVKTFIDDEELRKGEEISSALLKAIEGSKISIVIFSENYASSSWCLDELVKIVECKQLKQQLVWPVFYKVDPSVVRHQNGKYGEALAKHELRFRDNMDKVKRWRTALRDVANLSGWTFLDGHEASFTSSIAEEISAQVAKRSYFNVAKYPVGIESRVQDVLKLLDVGGSDVRMVGIWGIGGIGKTTVAKALFNTVRHKFEGWCFLANVRATSEPNQGLVQLQNYLLHEIFGGQKMEMITDADRGIQVIKERLSGKRVLLVLDDVNELNQLEKLAGGFDWFGRGSRIIITTRDRQVLTSHQVHAICTAQPLKNDEARNLLILNAFKENRNPDACVKFPIDTAVRVAHGLPLAINILGSLLCGKSINQWHEALYYHSRFPNSGIQKVLETSYDALEYPLKEAFLDIACFLNGKEKDYVMKALDSCYLNPSHAIEVLEEKALINFDQFGRIWMHDLLEEMGKEKVREKSPDDAGGRSRLWFHEDVISVLTENTGSEKVKGIRVQLPGEDEIQLSEKCFKKMKHLQLFININARFSGEIRYLPNQLRFLDWPGFPAQSLPSDFNPKKLVQLNISNSRFSQIGQGLKNLQNLKSLSFRSCRFITEVPDLYGRFPNLERLDLSECTSLAELHPSVGFLDKLVELHIESCCKLRTFPRIVNMKSLERISFEGCKRLEDFPEIVGRMESLTRMNVSGTAIKELPSSIGYQLFNLSELRFYHCENLTSLPLSMYRLQRLYWLEFRGCAKLALNPFSNMVEYCEASNANISNHGKQISSGTDSDGDDDDQGNSTFPSLSNFVSLPAGLSKLNNLEHLLLKRCKNLQEVSELPPNLRNLNVSGCVSLERIAKLSNILKRQESQMLENLNLINCWRLCGNLVQEAEKEIWLLNDKIDDHHQVKADFLSLILSSQKSAFWVYFPANHGIPDWLSCRIIGFREDGVYEFDIHVLPNFKWDNTGLALWVADAATTTWRRRWKCEIFIDELRVTETDEIVDGELHYVPFNSMDMSGFGVQRPVPPFDCRVRIRNLYPPPGSDEFPKNACGVHLAMPPNVECMKISSRPPAFV